MSGLNAPAKVLGSHELAECATKITPRKLPAIYTIVGCFLCAVPPPCVVFFYVSALNAPAKVLGSRELAECTSKSLRLSQVGLNALANVLGSRERAECASKNDPLYDSWNS